MTGRIEKTVFISYRRTNLSWALAIYQNLTTNGYDVFFDYQSINSGDFEQIILGNIRARAHFLVLLTPSALERCVEPNDWLRREIETALDEKRNIVPLFFEGFDFGSPTIAKYLTDQLAMLKNYNGMNVPSDYFEEAMGRLQTRFLNVALDAVLHPISNEVQAIVQKQKIAANQATSVKQEELTAQEWHEKGKKFCYSKNYDEAIHCYDQAIGIQPEYGRAYLDRSISREYVNDFDGAIEDFSTYIRLEKDDVWGYQRRGNVYKKKGNLDKAIQDFTHALVIRPNQDSLYADRALIRLERGDLDGAIRDWTSYIEINKNDSHGYSMRAIMKKRKGDLYGALNDYTEAIHLNSTQSSLFADRAQLLEEKGDIEGAIKDLSHAIQLKPDVEWYYTNRAALREKKGDFDNALKDYSEAIKVNPKNRFTYLIHRGDVLMKKGSVDEAIREFNEAISLKPNSESAYIRRGHAQVKKGNLNDALNNYNRAIVISPQNASSYLARGNFFQAKGELDRAVKDFSEAIRLNPKSSYYYLTRAVTLFDLSQSFFETLKIILNDPANEKVSDYLIQLDTYLDHHKSAINDLNAVIMLRDPLHDKADGIDVDKMMDQWQTIYNNNKKMRTEIQEITKKAQFIRRFGR